MIVYRRAMYRILWYSKSHYTISLSLFISPVISFFLLVPHFYPARPFYSLNSPLCFTYTMLLLVLLSFGTSFRFQHAYHYIPLLLCQQQHHRENRPSPMQPEYVYALYVPGATASQLSEENEQLFSSFPFLLSTKRLLKVYTQFHHSQASLYNPA